MADIFALYNELEKSGLLEDRREYDVADLKVSYPELSDQEAYDLFYLIQCDFNPGP